MNNVKFKYVRNPSKKIDMTLVTSLEKSDVGNTVRCGWAFRSNHDVFKKKEGRELAVDRMNNKEQGYAFSFDVATPIHEDIIHTALSYIRNLDTTPKKYKEEIFEYLYWNEFRRPF